jgi:hypothetical protein
MLWSLCASVLTPVLGRLNATLAAKSASMRLAAPSGGKLVAYADCGLAHCSTMSIPISTFRRHSGPSLPKDPKDDV